MMSEADNLIEEVGRAIYDKVVGLGGNPVFCIYMTPEFYHKAMSEKDHSVLLAEFKNEGTIHSHTIQITRPLRAGMPNHPDFRIVEVNDDI